MHQGDINTVPGQGLALPGQILWSVLPQSPSSASVCHVVYELLQYPSIRHHWVHLGAQQGTPACACLGPAVISCPLGSPGAWLSPALGARAAARGVQHPCRAQHSYHAQHPPCAQHAPHSQHPRRTQHPQPSWHPHRAQRPCTILPLGVTCYKKVRALRCAQQSPTWGAPAMGAGLPGMPQGRGAQGGQQKCGVV